MSYIDAATYIKKQQEQQVPKEKIVESLKAAGWYDADITLAFNMKEKGEAVQGEKNSYATAALILGICSFCFSALIPVSITGIVFGILALVKKKTHHTSAVWGLTLSSVGLVFGIIFWICLSLGFFSILGGHDCYDCYSNGSHGNYPTTQQDDRDDYDY